MSQCEDDTLNQAPGTEILLNTGAPIDNTVWVQSFEGDVWDLTALFDPPQQWQLCHSIVVINLSKT